MMASIRAATFSMEARVSARRSCGERDLASEAVGDGLAGASTSMASAFGAAAIGSRFGRRGERRRPRPEVMREEAAVVSRTVGLLKWAPDLQ